MSLEGGGVLDPGPDGVPADCPSCGWAFTVARSRAGSYANCPKCGKAVLAEGGRDWLWRFVQLGWVGLSVGAGYLVYRGGGSEELAPALGVGLAGLCAGWALSKAL